MNAPTCAACRRPLPPARTGRPRLYCSPRCRKAASRARARAWACAPPERPAAAELVALAAAFVPPAASPDDQVAAAVLAAVGLVGALRRLGCEARPEFAWRCAQLAERLDAALVDLFGEALP